MHQMLHCHDKAALQVIFVAEGAFETFLKYLHQVAVSEPFSSFRRAEKNETTDKRHNKIFRCMSPSEARVVLSLKVLA